MDVRAKQRLSCSRCLLNSNLRVFGFAPRHLNRSMASLKPMKLFYQTTFLVSLLFCVALSVAAQKEEVFPTRQLSEFVDAKPDTCAYTHYKVDILTQNTPKDKALIVIARLSDKDLKPNLNKRRLHNIRAYLTQAVGEQFRRDPQTIILAEGEPVKGYGQVEFYLDGRLVEVLKARWNSDLNFADCYGGIDGEPPCAEDWQKLFYPCIDYVEKQKRKVVPKKKKARK